MCDPLDRSFKIAMIFRPGAPTEGSKCRVAKPKIDFRVTDFWESAPLLWPR
jgi:hypothetical protein